MNRPAPVEVSYKNMRFLITHNPTNATLSTFIEVSGLAGCPRPPERIVAANPGAALRVTGSLRGHVRVSWETWE